jgi:hypothetical protein
VNKKRIFFSHKINRFFFSQITGRVFFSIHKTKLNSTCTAVHWHWLTIIESHPHWCMLMQFVHVVSCLCNDSPLPRCVVHIKLTLIGIRSIMTHHVPRMKDNLICSTDCACCIMLMQWLTSTALRQNHIITSTVLSPYESYNVYRLVKWVTQLLTAPIATLKLYLDPRFSCMTQPISQLVSWPYTEKRLPLVNLEIRI